ncbi:uncharacterized protein HKW66_Vig0183980 [Vigna angularis]|uniref:Uncharacterized protein n=1 Tax=Phaseolus angularis TaxID=3914 RepID=A0A8T0KVD2_PHAAN|nr:uncharacterized protein HKW66_Vig0183980 [Vigna angularis]
MASSSSRHGKKAAHLVRNASPNGWISDDEERYKFGCYRKLFKVVPHMLLDVELFRREGFIFQEWLVDVGLLKFVEMTGDCYLDLVQVFYHNLKVVDGVICSRVKGVDIKIDDEIWLSFTSLKAEGFMSHERNSKLNQWTNKKKIYKEYLRSPTRLKVYKPHLLDGEDFKSLVHKVEESDKLEDMKLDAAKAEVEATKEVLKRTEMAEAANKPVENELTKQLQTGQKK